MCLRPSYSDRKLTSLTLTWLSSVSMSQPSLLPKCAMPRLGAHLMSLAQNKEHLLALESIRRPGRTLGLSIWPHQWALV